MGRKRRRPPNLDVPRDGRIPDQGPATKDCPYCWGEGRIERGLIGRAAACPWCMGTGKVRLGDGRPIEVR